ncbi:MAG: hypothetical protein LUE27_03450 [Clostridia bacterium]|nr:hypothetical protein [Clostridia bacterium]
MSVMLQKDKKTGETLVYETTNYRDKKTGKSGTKKELLGRLYTSSLEQDIDDVSTMFDEAPHVWGDISALYEKTVSGAEELTHMLDKTKGVYTLADFLPLLEKFMEISAEKDEAFNKLGVYTKEIVMKAAEVARDNKLYKQDLATVREGKTRDEWNSTWMAKEIETYEKLEQNNAELKEISEKLIAEQKDTIEFYKKYVDELNESREIKQNLIDNQDKLIANQDNIISSHIGIINSILDSLSKYEDVSEWDFVKEDNEIWLAALKQSKSRDAVDDSSVEDSD